MTAQSKFFLPACLKKLVSDSVVCIEGMVCASCRRRSEEQLTVLSQQNPVISILGSTTSALRAKDRRPEIHCCYRLATYLRIKIWTVFGFIGTLTVAHLGAVVVPTDTAILIRQNRWG